jgi:hypothetical protein
LSTGSTAARASVYRAADFDPGTTDLYSDGQPSGGEGGDRHQLLEVAPPQSSRPGRRLLQRCRRAAPIGSRDLARRPRRVA